MSTQSFSCIAQNGDMAKGRRRKSKMNTKQKNSDKSDTINTGNTDLRLTLQQKAADKNRRAQLTENLRQFLNKSSEEPQPTIDLRQSMKRKITSSSSQEDLAPLKQKYSGLGRTVINSSNTECSESMNQESQNISIVPFIGVHVRVRKRETIPSITEPEKRKDNDMGTEVVVIDDDDDDDIEILDEIPVQVLDPIPIIGLEPIMKTNQIAMSHQLLEIRGRKRESFQITSQAKNETSRKDENVINGQQSTNNQVLDPSPSSGLEPIMKTNQSTMSNQLLEMKERKSESFKVTSQAKNETLGKEENAIDGQQSKNNQQWSSIFGGTQINPEPRKGLTCSTSITPPDGFFSINLSNHSQSNPTTIFDSKFPSKVTESIFSRANSALSSSSPLATKLSSPIKSCNSNSLIPTSNSSIQNSGLKPTTGQLECSSDGQKKELLPVKAKLTGIDDHKSNDKCNINKIESNSLQITEAEKIEPETQKNTCHYPTNPSAENKFCADKSSPSKPKNPSDKNNSVNGQLNTKSLSESNTTERERDVKKTELKRTLPARFDPSVPPPPQKTKRSPEASTPASNLSPEKSSPLHTLKKSMPQLTKSATKSKFSLPNMSNPPPLMSNSTPPKNSSTSLNSKASSEKSNTSSCTSPKSTISASSAPSTSRAPRQIKSTPYASGPTMYCYDGDELKQTGLRPIVIDGSNVAKSHANASGKGGNKFFFSVKGIDMCIQFFKKRGHSNIKAFLPEFRRKDGYDLLTKLEEEGHIVFTPSRRVDGRSVMCHDDNYIVDYAKQTGGIIISRDQYRDIIKNKPDLKTTVDQQLLMPAWAGNFVMFPHDPLGKDGPNLDQFLKFESDSEKEEKEEENENKKEEQKAD